METTFAARLGGNLSASLHLAGLSVRRLLRSRQTLVSAFLLGFAVVAVVAWSIRRERTPAQFVEQVFVTVYMTVLLPVFCLSYGTAGIAADREERTLVYLLVTPLPRPLIFAAKALASYALSLAWTMGSLTLLCWLAGDAGQSAWQHVWSPIGWSTLAYVSLFLLFSVLFRRATILAFAYALFLETFVGNLPGIAQRLAISFYTRCLIADSCADLNVDFSSPDSPAMTFAVTGSTAQLVLGLLSAGVFLLALSVFSQREYT